MVGLREGRQDEGGAEVIRVGIDPGKHTGFAAWCDDTRKLSSCKALLIHEAMDEVLQLHRAGQLHSVTFEDARLRTWFGGADARQAKSGAGVREGVGSVKRDCTIWADFLGAHGIAYRAVKPQAGATKWTAEQFQRVTGWAGRTNEHARDAALLVVR